MQLIAVEGSRFEEDGEVLHSFHPLEWSHDDSRINLDDEDRLRRLPPEQRFLPCHYFDYMCGSGTGAYAFSLIP